MCPQQRSHRRRRRRGARCAAKPGCHPRGTERGGAGRAGRAGRGSVGGEQLLTAPTAPQRRPRGLATPHAPCLAWPRPAAPRPPGGGRAARAAPSPLTRRARDRYRRRRRSACPAAALRSPPRPLFGPAPSAARAPACLFLFSSPQRHGRQRRRGLAGCRPPPQPIGRRGCPWVGTGGFSARRKRKGERGGRAKPSRGRRRGGTGKEPFVRGGEQEAGRLGPGPSAARPVRRRPAERRLQAAAWPAGHGDQRRVHRGGEGGASV